RRRLLPPARRLTSGPDCWAWSALLHEGYAAPAAAQTTVYGQFSPHSDALQGCPGTATSGSSVRTCGSAGSAAVCLRSSWPKRLAYTRLLSRSSNGDSARSDWTPFAACASRCAYSPLICCRQLRLRDNPPALPPTRRPREIAPPPDLTNHPV